MNFKKMYLLVSTFLFIIVLVSEAESARRRSYKKSAQYKAPSREIVLSTYGGFIYANNLYTVNLEDQSGFGGGINMRTELYKNFGYLLDVFIPRLKIIEEENLTEEGEPGPEFVAIYTGGFYYSIPGWKFDLSYGAISSGVNIMTIFVPGVEYNRYISKRISVIAKVGYLITNDWFSDMGYEENYTSFMASVGVSMVF
jgi:hypothetical protein